MISIRKRWSQLILLKIVTGYAFRESKSSIAPVKTIDMRNYLC